MNALTALLSQGVAERLGWTLLHSLWEATLIAAALAIVLRLLAKSSAQLRYAAACAAMVAMALLPAATGGLLSLPARNAPAASTSMSPPFTTPAPIGMELAAAAAPAVPAQASSERAREQSWREVALDTLESALPYAVGVWLAGVLLFSLRHLLAWTRVQQLRRMLVRPADASLRDRLSSLARKLGIERAVRLVESGLVRTPAVIGWLRPMILLPASAVTGLNPEQLEALLLHELAHIRRHDYLVNLVQTILEILGFYHPAVWWVSRRIRIERENCCDDVAARALGDNLRYARALASMEDLRADRPEPAMAASGGSLLARIRRLVGRSPNEGSSSTWAPVLVVGLLLLVAAVPVGLAIAEEYAGPTNELERALLKGFAENHPSAVMTLMSDAGKRKAVHFPADRSTGTLYTREWDFPTDSYTTSLYWRKLGEARGDVTIPAGKALKLDVDEGAWRAGSLFNTLQPGDIQMLDFSECENANDSILASVAKLRGLRALSLAGTEVTGEGLGHLKGTPDLRWLCLASTPLNDEGAAHLADLGSLEYLNLRYTKITDAAMAHVARIRGLKWLSLDADAVGDEGMAQLKASTSLQGLSLWKCGITDKGLEPLAGLTNLVVLELVDTRITDRGLVCLAGMQRLKSLRLTGTGVMGEGLAHLRSLKSLEYVELPDNDIKDEQLAYLADLDHLKGLRIVSNESTEKGFKWLASLQSPLEELETGGQGVTDDAAAAIGRSSLKSLWIQRAPLTDEGLARLTQSRAAGSLEKLRLTQVNITGAGLAALKGLPRLKELTLEDLYIGEGEFAALDDLTTLSRLAVGRDFPGSKMAFGDRDMAALANLKYLRSLAIVSNQVTDAGLQHLSGLKFLDDLSLSGQGITDAGLGYLEGLGSLKSLSLSGTRVTREGVERLRKAMPGLECRL
ncbi:MAG: M56 family metallopeptidase [Phycisphaerales bacterium]